jgi:signal transduction histidine kinase
MNNPSKIFFAFIFILSGLICNAQQPTVRISDSMFENLYHTLRLSEKAGWYFKPGNDTAWTAKEISLNGWEKMQPAQFNQRYADANGRAEGWFRIKISIDSKLSYVLSGMISPIWASSDVYVDGTLVTSFGQTGSNGKPFRENRSYGKEAVPIGFKAGEVYTIAVHLVDYLAPFSGSLKSSERFGLLLVLTTSQTPPIAQLVNKGLLRQAVLLSITGVICILFWFLWLLNSRQKNLLLFALCCTCLSGCILVPLSEYAANEITFERWLFDNVVFALCFAAGQLLVFMIIKNTLNYKGPRWFNITVYVLLGIVLVSSLLSQLVSIAAVINILWVVACIFIVVKRWKKLKGAQWAIVTALILGIILAILSFGNGIIVPSLPEWASLLIYSTAVLSFPLGLLIYAAIRFKEINHETQIQADKVVQLSEEKKQQAINQQKILEEEVKRQTSDLTNTLNSLKSTQAQLIQSEKMASLGELTAGIAHEIQNPLNFVNNFSEVNAELVEELKSELATGNQQSAIEIADGIRDNSEKINHHGKRADAIVKGMLLHSRTSTGQKESVDINGLADEYLRLAYHGLRAKDKTFNAKFETDFDPSIGKINIVPQEIGRVILNLINNAFYAVDEKKKVGIENYEPTVTVSTKKINGKVEVRVKDNGNGIPQKILDKIFQPFFTTKPTGQGTGLGLSLSHDIIKAHGGELKVETKEGEGAEFIIHLPS